MSYFDDTIPADSEGVKQGASRIRAMKTSLNSIIAQIFNDSGVFLAKWVTGAMIANDAAVDGDRAISSNHIQNNAVITRTLPDGVLSADATGQGKMADGFLSADDTGRGKMADAFITLAKLAWSTFFTDAPAKATPVAADLILIGDSAASNVAKQCTLLQAKQVGNFTSAEQAIVTGATISVAHSLGAIPVRVRWVLVCKTADLGYSVGQEVDVATAMNGNNNNAMAMFGADATNVFLVINTHVWQIYSQTTFGAASITTGNWKLKCYASLA